MKKLISLCAATMLSLFSFAQEAPAFSWGYTAPKPDFEKAEVRILSADGQSYYVLTHKHDAMSFGTYLRVEGFKASNERTFMQEISVDGGKDYAGLVMLGGRKLQLLYGLYEKETKENVLYAQALNASAGNEGEPVRIAAMSAEKASRSGRFEIGVSPDGKRLAVVGEYDMPKDVAPKLLVAVYGDNLAKQAEYTWDLALDLAKINYRTPVVNNSGTVFIGGDIAIKSKWHIVLEVCRPGDKITQDYRIEPEGEKRPLDMMLNVSRNGDLIAAGYYTDDPDKFMTAGNVNCSGTWFMRLDGMNGKQKSKTQNAFAKKTKQLVMRSIVESDKGNLCLAGEVAWDMSRSTGVQDPKHPGSPIYDYEYNAHEIVLSLCDANGKATGTEAVIQKANESKNDGGVNNSFLCVFYKDSYYVVFNDFEYNYMAKKPAVLVGYQPKLPVLAAVSEATAQASAPIALRNNGGVGGKGVESLMNPSVYLELGAGKYIVRAENRNLAKMGSLVFTW